MADRYRPLAREHGTERGYKQHAKYEDPTCVDCRIAHGQYSKELRAAERAKKRLTTRQAGSSRGTGVDFANIYDPAPEEQRAAGLAMAGVAITFPYGDAPRQHAIGDLRIILKCLGIKEDREQNSGSSE